MIDHSRPLLLVLNVGSSSVKFSLYDAATENPCLGHGSFAVLTNTERLVFNRANGARDSAAWPRTDGSQDDSTLLNLMEWIGNHAGGHLCAVAHRVIDGDDCSVLRAQRDPQPMPVTRRLMEPDQHTICTSRYHRSLGF